jgi:hypothetical protein
MLQRGHVRPQRSILKHEACAAAIGRHVVAFVMRDRAVDADRSACGTIEASDATQQRWGRNGSTASGCRSGIG